MLDGTNRLNREGEKLLQNCRKLFFFFQIVVKIAHSNKCYKGKDQRSGRKKQWSPSSDLGIREDLPK